MRQTKKKYLIGFLLIFAFNLTTAGSAVAATISVNNSTGPVADFTSIQAAINAAHSGDEIIVKPGTYVENLNVSKNLTISSESGNPSDTIIQAARSSEDVFILGTNGVTIKGFSIKGSEYSGIHFFGVTDCYIQNNDFSNNGCSIDLYLYSSGNTLDNNSITDSSTGISLGDSWYNILSNNSVSSCTSGISLFDSTNNTLKDNQIFENSEGISLIGESNGNILMNNTLNLNENLGLQIYETSNNLIYNNYFNNTLNLGSDLVSGTNIWNSTKIEGTNIVGGPYLGGNFWTRPDGTIYPEEGKDTDLDGIFDAQYNIENSEFIDFLPLKESKPTTITVKNSTGEAADFTSIQAAIDNSLPGDIILVSPGIYNENVDLYVTNVSLMSESGNPEDTIIQPVSNSDDTLYVIADGVTISGFNVKGPVSSPNARIHLNGVKYCCIENNQLLSNDSNSSPEFGLLLDSCSSNELTNNTISGNGTSVFLTNSSENVLINNTAYNSSYGFWVDSSGNNTLNMNNASNSKVGIYLKASTGNILSNSTLLNNTYSGIYMWGSAGNTLNNSTAENNNVSIVLYNSSGNLLNRNTVSDNNYGIWLYSYSNDNKLIDNMASNNKVGINIKTSNGNMLADNKALNSTGPGIILWDSVGNMLENNKGFTNGVSVILHNSSKNILANNTAASNIYGIWLNSSSENELNDNVASNNILGVYLKTSSYNKLSGNEANLSSKYGIYLGASMNNILNNNRVASNSEYGIFLLDSKNNSIYNNYFNNANNIYFSDTNSSSSLNTTRTPGTNILGGPYLGGNFWATPDGDGFSQIQADSNEDGICDVAYTAGNGTIDYLPLAGSGVMD